MPDQAQTPGGDAPTLDTSPLPAPYRNPWRSLADDLRAVVADLRLRLQEVWRRNGEGSLWLPNAWPRDLAPLFWPLVLGVVVLVLVATAVKVTTFLGAAPAGQSLAPAPLALSPSPERPHSEKPAAPGEGPSQSPSAVLQPESPQPLDQPQQTSQFQQPSQVQQLSQVQQPAAAEPAGPLSKEAPQPAEPDPLLSLVLGRETQAGAAPVLDGEAVKGMAVVLAADADRARNAVVITLGKAWSALPTAERQTLAEDWWDRIEREGYSALMLRSESGLVLGRSARVGQGMVLNAIPPRLD